MQDNIFNEVADGVTHEPFAETADAASGNHKNLIQELEQLKKDGHVGTKPFVDKMREMEVLLGISQISPFGTNELEIFETSLAQMSLADMQKLAHKVGVNPLLEFPRLKQMLTKEFTSYARNNRRNIMPSPVQSFEIDPSNPLHDKLKRILSDI